MVRTPLTERRKEQTRRDIAEAAIGLFLRDGYETASVEAIATEAGVSERTFYRYFATKDDVLSPIIAEGTAELAELIAARPAGEPLAEAVYQAYASASASVDQVQVQALIRVLVTVPALRARWLSDLLTLENALTAAITSRVALDDTHAQLTAAVITAAIRVTLERSTHTGFDATIAEALGDALRYLAEGAQLHTV